MAYCRWSLGISSRVWPPIGTPPGLGVGIGLEEERVELRIGLAARHAAHQRHVDMEPDVACRAIVGRELALHLVAPHDAGQLDRAGELALRRACAGSFCSEGTKPRSNSTIRAVVGPERRHDLQADRVLEAARGEIEFLVVQEAARDLARGRTRGAADRPCSSSSSVIGAAAWLVAMRSRMSRFHSRRSICQTPRPSENTKIGSEMSVGQKAAAA